MMIYFRLISLILSVFLCFNLYAHTLSKPPGETQQIALISKIIKHSTSSQMHKVWPNFDMSQKPVFITYGNGHIYAFNFKPKEGEWKSSRFEDMDILYTDKDLWGITTSPMQFNFEIENQEAFVFRLDMMPNPQFLPFFVMVHERFHVYQMGHFASEKHIGVGQYTESENPKNLALMQVEEKILLNFLKALVENKRNEAMTHLKTYLAVSKIRRNLLSGESLTWEDRQQMVEGLADYTAAKYLDVFGYFGKQVGLNHIIHTMVAYAQDEDISARALKWRHYGVGSSLAYALDFLNVPDWKIQVEQNVALQSILEKHLKISEMEGTALYLQSMQQYEYSHLFHEIHDKIEAYKSMLNKCRTNFDQEAGLVINIQTPPRSGISAGGYSKGVYSLSDGSMLSIEDTSKISSADSLWNLEFKSIPYLYQTNDGFRRFKDRSESLVLTLDGKICQLKDIKGQKAFHALTLQGERCRFISNENPGIIYYQDGELKITYLSSAENP